MRGEAAIITVLGDRHPFHQFHHEVWPKYQTTSNLDNAQLLPVGNLDNDNVVNNADLQGLIVLLANSSGTGSIAAVPEPGWIALLLAGVVILPAFRSVRSFAIFRGFCVGQRTNDKRPTTTP